MEEPVLTLDSTRLRAEPGGQVQLGLTVTNPGHLVESFRLDLVGLDQSWYQIHPPEVSVYPGQQGTAIVVLSPPANSHAPEEALPFAVRAVSTLDPDRSVVEEADLEVGRILDLQAAISPVTSRGRWSGGHQVLYTNWGNSVVHLRLSVLDKDQVLGFRIEPEQVTVPVGGQVSARVRVRPRKPALRGAPAQRAFQVIGESGQSRPVPGYPRSAAARAGVPDAGRPVLDAVMLQQPILSRTVLVLAGLLLAGAAAAGALLLHSAGVKGAGTTYVAPGQPSRVQAKAVSSSVIQLSWGLVDRADKYQVLQFDGAGAATGAAPQTVIGTSLAVAVGQPKQEVCFAVVAIRTADNLQSPPSSPNVCATSRDNQLRAPTNVKAVQQASGGFSVTWTDNNPQNDHLVLVDGAAVGAPVKAGQTAATVAIPAGEHDVQVQATRGETLSSKLSGKFHVSSSGPASQATTPSPSASSGAGPSGTVSPSAGSGSGSGSTLTGWLVVFNGNPYQEVWLADSFLAEVRVNSPQAQVVPTGQIDQGGNADTLYVVVPGFADQASAKSYCAGVAIADAHGCIVIPAP